MKTIENTRGCCEKCWNSKFALRGKWKEKFGCGLACDCHRQKATPPPQGMATVYPPLKMVEMLEQQVADTPPEEEPWVAEFHKTFSGPLYPELEAFIRKTLEADRKAQATAILEKVEEEREIANERMRNRTGSIQEKSDFQIMTVAYKAALSKIEEEIKKMMK